MWNEVLQGLAAFWPYLAIALLVLCSAFFSGTETGAYRVNRVRVHLGVRQGRRGARSLLGILQDMPALIITLLIGNNIVVYLATLKTTQLFMPRFGQHEIYAEIAATAVMTPVLFVLAELVPKNIFSLEADRLMYPAAWPLLMLERLLKVTGVIWAMKGVTMLWQGLWRRLSHGKPETLEPLATRPSLRSVLRDVAAEGLVTPYQNELAEKIMNLRLVHVADAMVPVTRIASVPANADNAAFRRLVEQHKFSRMPVLDPAGREVLGIVAVHEVLQQVGPAERLEVRKFVKQALELEPGMSITQAIFGMQRARVQMAIVRNPRGSFVGIVTLKDLVEEIVGDLRVG